jgi:hypothetical protein
MNQETSRVGNMQTGANKNKAGAHEPGDQQEGGLMNVNQGLGRGRAGVCRPRGLCEGEVGRIQTRGG